MEIFRYPTDGERLLTNRWSAPYQGAGRPAAELPESVDRPESFYVRVNHAIRSLEKRPGVSLFNRTTRSVALTEAGSRASAKPPEPPFQRCRLRYRRDEPVPGSTLRPTADQHVAFRSPPGSRSTDGAFSRHVSGHQPPHRRRMFAQRSCGSRTAESRPAPQYGTDQRFVSAHSPSVGCRKVSTRRNLHFESAASRGSPRSEKCHVFQETRHCYGTRIC